MIEDDIKQTRCTTCDADHPYKGARVPKRRRKESPVVAGALALTADALPSMDAVSTDAVAALTRREDAELSMHNDEDAPRMPSGSPRPMPEERIASREDESAERDVDSEPHALIDDAPAADGPVHRPLIRATLPRPEGQKDARPLPDFTVRHSPARGPGGHGGNGNFRGERMRLRSGGNGSGNGHNGNRAFGGGSRYQGGSGNRPPGQGRQSTGRGGAPSGFRNGNAGPNGKRGRGSRG